MSPIHKRILVALVIAGVVLTAGAAAIFRLATWKPPTAAWQALPAPEEEEEAKAALARWTQQARAARPPEPDPLDEPKPSGPAIRAPDPEPPPEPENPPARVRLEILEEELNQLLRSHPETRDALRSNGVLGAHLTFEAEEVTAEARLMLHDQEVHVTAAAKPEIGEAGLRFALKRATLGRLPAPPILLLGFEKQLNEALSAFNNGLPAQPVEFALEPGRIWLTLKPEETQEEPEPAGNGPVD